MKKFLLTLAAAAFIAGTAMAQVLPKMQAGKTNRHSFPESAYFNKSLTQKLSLSTLSNTATQTTLSTRHTRMDDAQRSHKELSYQVNGNEKDGLMIGPLYEYSTLNNAGITGYGFAQAYYSDYLSRLKGNVISQIDFLAYDANYTGTAIAFIMDPVNNQLLWTGEIESIQTFNENSQELPVNSVACDYEITGDEQIILVGWICLEVTPKKSGDYVYMPMYQDGTGQGYGAYFMIGNTQGQMGVEGSYAQWSMQGGGSAVTCSHIVIQTTGDNALKDNDVMPYKIGVARADAKGRGGDVQVSFANLGLDPVSSIDYTFECDGQTKSGSYSFGQNALPFYNDANLTLMAQTATKPGNEIGKFTITKVNTVNDEYPADNDLEYNVITMEKGYNRTPVVEEFTSVKCGWCPRGLVSLGQLEKAYGEDIVLIANHYPSFQAQNDDPLGDASYQKVLDTYGINSAPLAMVNRQYQGDPYYDAPTFVSAVRNQGISEANMVLKAGAAGMGSNINAEVTLDFAIDAEAGAYGIAYVFTEDGITGIDQDNYFTYYLNQYMQKYPTMTAEQIIQALFGDESGYVDPEIAALCTAGTTYQPEFNHTSRSIINPLGSEKEYALPEVKAGTPVKVSSRLTLPTVNNRKNVKLAALLIDLGTGVVVTGRQVALGNESNASAIDEVEGAAAQISVNNGAFDVKADNAKAEVYSVDGKLISSCTVNGEASLPTFGKGVYVIRVVANGKVYTEKATF